MASRWFGITAVSLHAGKLRHRFSNLSAPVSFPFKRRNDLIAVSETESRMSFIT